MLMLQMQKIMLQMQNIMLQMQILVLKMLTHMLIKQLIMIMMLIFVINWPIQHNLVIVLIILSKIAQVQGEIGGFSQILQNLSIVILNSYPIIIVSNFYQNILIYMALFK